MTRLAISVEGETEEGFVNKVLAEHLWEWRVYPEPFLLGGDVRTGKLVPRMVNMSYKFDSVTSLMDFYGSRRKGDATPEELEQSIDNAISARVRDNQNIFSYVQVHEFEGLLFSNVNAFKRLDNVSESTLDELQSIREGVQTPEDINDSVDTAPSKQITKLIPRYNKVADGTQLAATIGLDTIRDQCPRFDEWLTRLESLGSAPMAE